MVRSILDGRKTQTRRVVNPQPRGFRLGSWIEVGGLWHYPNVCPFVRKRCPYGQPGDRLWVRETFFVAGSHVKYKASYDQAKQAKGLWKPSIHMPRRLARILLEMESVRVERLQDIIAADIEREGVLDKPTEINEVLPLWIELWDSINGKRGFGWDVNPWVWVVTFKRV